MSVDIGSPGVRSVAVLGAGVMGTGIAATVAGHGLPVTLVDTSQEALERARLSVRHQLRHARLMEALPEDGADAEVALTGSLKDVAGAGVVIEAIDEDSAAKAEVLAEAAGLTGSTTPLVTNTSGIPIDELAGALPEPERLVGTHFMNPTYLIDQVEVVRGKRTSDATTEALTGFLTALRRRPVVVRDSPGFVTSRLLHPMINDAARIVGEGVATVEDVDELMQGCLGHPTGPLRTGDLIGLDNLVTSLEAMYERTGEERHKPCEQLLAKVRQGELGRKTRRGFHDYREGPA